MVSEIINCEQVRVVHLLESSDVHTSYVWKLADQAIECGHGGFMML
jgi:hypothetical protein